MDFNFFSQAMFTFNTDILFSILYSFFGGGKGLPQIRWAHAANYIFVAFCDFSELILTVFVKCTDTQISLKISCQWISA